MTKTSIKFSNLTLFKDELLHRLRKCTTVADPMRKTLYKAIKNEDWKTAVRELVYRFEGYCDGGIINYSHKIRNMFMEASAKAGVDQTVEMIMESYF